MAYTFDSNIVSDLHKDALGFRPSSHFWDAWKAASDDRKQAIWDGLMVDLERSIKEDEAREQAAIKDFEGRIEMNLLLGAPNREDAIRWIVESLDIGEYGDAGYVCYLLGLPYSMEGLFLPALRERRVAA